MSTSTSWIVQEAFLQLLHGWFLKLFIFWLLWSFLPVVTLTFKVWDKMYLEISTLFSIYYLLLSNISMWLLIRFHRWSVTDGSMRLEKREKQINTGNQTEKRKERSRGNSEKSRNNRWKKDSLGKISIHNLSMTLSYWKLKWQKATP